MALIKQINSNAVHWRIKGNNSTSTANEMIAHFQLPADLRSLFASLRVNGRNYEWHHADTGWQPAGQADEAVRGLIDQKVADSRKRIVHHLAQKGAQAQAFGESLVKIPNDEDYVFFRHDEAQGLQILFTGWGFENSLTPTSPKVVITPEKKPQNVKLGFSIDGQMQPGRQFTLAAGNRPQLTQTTGSDGYFTVGELNAGTSLQVVDLKTGMSFALEVMAGQENYVSDVTQQAKVQVMLQRDHAPVQTVENVVVSYHGQSQTLQAEPGQSVAATFTWWEGEQATVSALGESETRVLQIGTNLFTFDVVTPPARVKVHMVHADGTPYVGESVQLIYATEQRTLVTDSLGEATLSLPYRQGISCVVITGLGTQQQELKAGFEQVFDFREVREEPLTAPVVVRLLQADGQPMAGQNGTADYDGAQHTFTTNAQGEARFVLPYVEGRQCTVTTAIGSDRRELATAGENLFEFRAAQPTPPPPPPPSALDYHVRFIDHAEQPYRGVRVEFCQDEQRFPATLDEEGGTNLPNAAFDAGKPINILMHDTEERIENIVLQLEPDEYEYLIQTRPSKPSRWHWLWWTLLILSLGILTCLALLFTNLACDIFDPFMSSWLH